MNAGPLSEDYLREALRDGETNNTPADLQVHIQRLGEEVRRLRGERDEQVLITASTSVDQPSGPARWVPNGRGVVSGGLDTGAWQREGGDSGRWVIKGNGFVAVSVEPPDEFTPEWFVTDGGGGALLSGDDIQALARIVRWHEEHA